MGMGRELLAGVALGAAILAASCGGGGGGDKPSEAPASAAGQVFALMDVGDPPATLDAFAAHPELDGLAFRTSWKILEPLPGAHDWSTLDAALQAVRARGKKLTLHVGVASRGLPGWLAPMGSATYTYRAPGGELVTEPVPWDPVFLSRYEALVAALAAHIRARGDGELLHAVSDGAPVAEMSLAGCRDARLADGMPYGRSQYLDAWKRTVDAHAGSFPATRLLVSAPVAVICMPDNDGKAFYTEVMNHALAASANAMVFAADLNAAGSARLAQVDAPLRARAGVAFQMIWSSTGDTQDRMQGPLEAAVCQGLGSGGRYFEIYKADLSSTDAAVRGAIRRARAGQPC